LKGAEGTTGVEDGGGAEGVVDGATGGCCAGVLNSTLSAADVCTDEFETDNGGASDGSIRGGPAGVVLCSWTATSPEGRSGALSALGPVGGAAERPEGTLALGAVGTTVDVLTGTGGGTAGGGGGATTAGFGGGTLTAVLDLTSSAGALQTLDPKAGTAAGGDEGRGAYLSLDASARLANKASSFPGSRRESLLADGSMAREGRREYESTCGPGRSDGDA
jgi:hypothetical protein